MNIVTFGYKCIGVQGSQFGSGARMQQIPCDGTPSQQFMIVQYQGPLYRIKSAQAPHLCWTVPAANFQPGMNIQLNECSGLDAGGSGDPTQLFEFSPNEGTLKDV